MYTRKDNSLEEMKKQLLDLMKNWQVQLCTPSLPALYLWHAQTLIPVVCVLQFLLPLR